MITVGQIRDMVIGSGMSIPQVAEKSGISYKSIYKWYGEGVSPSVGNLAAVAQVCGYELKLVKRGEQE
jgi:DNA-binding phage protein